MFYILVRFWSSRLSGCTFCTCYRHFFVIAIDFSLFVATPPGIGGRPLVSFCTTQFLLIFLHTIGLCIYGVGSGDGAAHGCLDRFLVFAVLQSSRPTLQIIQDRKSVV